MAGVLESGAAVGSCRIERLIGRGGMGMVYLAEQVGLGRRVALKVIAPEFSHDLGFQQRFEREVRLAASLDHPNVVTVYEAGEDRGQLFLVMRYIEGQDLRQLIASDGPMSPRVAVDVVVQVASALDAAHGQGLVHRDIKPANVLVTRGQDRLHAYLSDFGLTKHMSSLGGLTQTGNWVGTADYVAPEQIQGAHVDARTDVYALGCVLHESLTGATPYPRDSDMAKMWAHVNAPPPRPTEQRGELSREFDLVVERALAKDPDQRFPSAGDMARATQAALEHRVATEPERSVATGQAAAMTEASATTAVPPAPPPRTKLEPMPGPPRRDPMGAPATDRRHRRWMPAAIAAIATLVLAGAATALVIAAGSSDKNVRPTTNANIVTVQQTVSGPSAPASGNGPSPPAATGTTTYQADVYSTEYPADWSVTKKNRSKGGFLETRFASADGAQSVLIDHTRGETLSPSTKAHQLVGDQSTTTTFQPVTLGGRPGFEWVFNDGGREKVDYLLNTGNDGYAVLGASSPQDFTAASAVARQVAESLRSTG